MTAELATLGRVLSRTALRMRVQRGLEWSAWAAAAGASAALLPFVPWQASLVASAAAAVLGAAWPRARAQVAACIDERCALEGRLGAALSFLASAQRSAFMDAAIRDADRRATEVRPALVAPMHVPRATPWAVSAATLLALATWWPHERAVPLATVPAAPVAAVPLLDHDELSALRAEAPHVDDATLQREVARYEALLREVAAGKDPATSIAAALALEAELASADGERAAREELAQALRRAAPAVSRALVDDPAQAARALRTWAERLQKGGVSAAERKELQAALERERARLAAQKESAGERSLLTKPESEPSLLKRPGSTQRQLDRLQRPGQTRALEKLRRELDDAARSLGEPQPERASEALKRGGDALDEMARERQERQQREQLQHAVAQLRELLQRRALSKPRGGGEQSDERGKSGESGRGRGLRSGQGGNTRMGSQGERNGAGQGGASGGTMQVAMPTTTTVEREEQRSIISAGGTAHDATRATPQPRHAVQYEDSPLAGVQGSGPTRSQVISGAAGAGFASVPYRKVYADYREHAESVLERDQVPAGARFHVRRYFELVRPRDQETQP